MNRRNVLICLFLVSILIFSTSCNRKKDEKISIKDVVSIEIYYNGIKEITYEKEKNSKEIQRLINAFNEANNYNNEGDTTNPIVVLIKLKNDSKVEVHGGAQVFQTVVRDNKQSNIQGEGLNDYFEELNKKFSQ